MLNIKKSLPFLLLLALLTGCRYEDGPLVSFRSPWTRLTMHPKKLTRLEKEEKMLAEINSVIEKLKEAPLKLGAKTGTSGKIFGSVTSLQISRAIREQRGYEIDRKKISITDEIKELGTYKATIDFGNGHNTEVEFEVVAE